MYDDDDDYVDMETVLYATYLETFAIVRSGGELDEDESLDEELLAAQAMGACDGQDHDFYPMPKFALLEKVSHLLHDKKAEPPCKVVSMTDEETAK